MRPATEEKYFYIQKRFHVLYHEERKRIDDCEAIIAKELFLSIATIRKALKYSKK